MSKLALVCLFLFVTAPSLWAGVTVKCRIDIEDVNNGEKYSLEESVIESEASTIIDFEIPGNDFACRLAFFDLKSGSALSCEYKQDGGHTFFMSDRSILEDAVVTNKLTFRHKSSFINIGTICE